MIKVALGFVQDAIIKGTNNLFGVTLYNTRQSENPNSFEGVYRYLPLQASGVDVIVKLRDLLKADKFEQSIGSGNAAFEFNTALWSCTYEFASQKQNASRWAPFPSGEVVV